MEMYVEITKGAFQALGNTMDLYNEILDDFAPFKTFKDKVEEIYLYSDYYSKESSRQLAVIRAIIADGIDSYYVATKFINDWIIKAIPILTTYIELFDKNTPDEAEAQKTLLLKLLDEGIDTLKEAQDDLGTSSARFNKASGRLTQLYIQLGSELETESKNINDQVSDLKMKAYIGLIFGPLGLLVANRVIENDFLPELNDKLELAKEVYTGEREKIAKTFIDIDVIKTKLNNEIRIVGGIKVHIETTKILAGIDHSLKQFIVESVEKLIKKCEDYRQKHIPTENRDSKLINKMEEMF